MPKRTYNENEIRALLERAVELQSKSNASRNKSGLSLSELEDIAAASDIDLAHLKQAVHELETQAQVGTTSTEITNTHVFVDHTVPGYLPEHAWEDLLIELRRRFGLATDEERVTEERTDTSLSWTHVDKDDRETQVYIDVRGDTVQIRLSQYVSEMGPAGETLVWGALVSIVFGSLAALFVYGQSSMWTVAGGYVAFFLLTVPVAYVIGRQRRRNALTQLTDLANRIADLVQPLSTASLRAPSSSETTTHQAKRTGRTERS